MSESSSENHAIIVVDPQPDFFEGGPLPIAGATATAERIAGYLRDRGRDYSLLIVTQDWHVDPGPHFSDEPDYVMTWPVHCVADTEGAVIHASLRDQPWDVVIRKGQREGAYSGFEGESSDGSTLADVLWSANVGTVTIIGFATDHCVKATALDARELGFEVRVLLDLCAGVGIDTTRDAVSLMANAGVRIKYTEDS